MANNLIIVFVGDFNITFTNVKYYFQINRKL